MSFKIFTKYLPALLLSTLVTGCGLCAQAQTPVLPSPQTPQPPPPQKEKVEVKPQVQPRVQIGPQANVTVSAQGAVSQPAQVLTIVHRLSGWKLKTWLDFTNAKILDPSLINQFVYTNIVAGYVLADGRSVVARLPEADAELLTLPAEFGFNNPNTRAEAPALTLVRRDGARLTAKFVGLDGSTWLTLLEAEGLNLQPSRDAADESLVVGQRVRLFAPLRAQRGQATAGVGGNGAAVYMRVGEIKGVVTKIARSSTGRVTALTVRAEGLSPQVTGGVVLNEAGETVGLIETSKYGEAQVMPASLIRRAAERVIRRRASVPRPLLGVRGEALSALSLKQLEMTGWKMEEASKLLNKQEGVLLTMIAPNSPAALANLRAGDIITRVNNDEVKNSEDFSFLLNEAGGNASVQLTVLRAASAPLEVNIKLSEAFSLRRATEMGRAIAQGNTSFYPISPVASASARAPEEMLAANATRASSISVTVQAAKGPSNSMLPTTVKPTSILVDLDWVVLPVDKSKPRAASQSMLLINAVRPGGSADRIGLRAGDLILSVNGQKLAPKEWAEKFLLRNATDLTLAIVRGGERLTLKYNKTLEK